MHRVLAAKLHNFKAGCIKAGHRQIHAGFLNSFELSANPQNKSPKTRRGN
jgi:hypothetical protein